LRRIRRSSTFVLDLCQHAGMKFLGCLVVLLLLSLPVHAESAAIEDAFSPHQGATRLIVGVIAEAHQSIRVAAYTFTSRPIADALIKAARRGVDVRVVLDMRQSQGHGNLASYLISNGILMRKNGEYSVMHDKFMVIDGKTLELGSFNYTKSAEERNAENVLVLRAVPKIAREYAEEWNVLWQGGV
jgi:phosphatidylserine/phosphatidylglycerophosphate/cardiolipin synthase-like enzyme